MTSMLLNAFDLQEAGPVADYGEYSLVEKSDGYEGTGI